MAAAAAPATSRHNSSRNGEKKAQMFIANL